MCHHRQVSVMVAIVILLVGSLMVLLADAAPPLEAPGSSIGSGGFETNVQMVSEEVLITVIEAEGIDITLASIAELFPARVEATFWMQNQGEDTESFDVWFPLSAPGPEYDGQIVKNFAAWVNEAPAEIDQEESAGEWDDVVPWATWPVTFLPGETVVLTVAYDLLPTGWPPTGMFAYVLETGAGWWGTIGEGTITVRLPYPVTEYNVFRPPVSENMDSFEVEGTDLIWRFSDLEPTADDNIYVNLMVPQLWRAIMDAEKTVLENPDSPEAYLELARAQIDGLSFYHGLMCCTALADAAIASLRQGLALEPDDVAIHLEYLDLMMAQWYDEDPETYPEEIPAVMAAALNMAPDDENVLSRLDRVMDTFLQMVDLFPESEALQAGFQDMLAALAEALETNPENARLTHYETIVSQFLDTAR